MLSSSMELLSRNETGSFSFPSSPSTIMLPPSPPTLPLPPSPPPSYPHSSLILCRAHGRNSLADKTSPLWRVKFSLPYTILTPSTYLLSLFPLSPYLFLFFSSLYLFIPLHRPLCHLSLSLSCKWTEEILSQSERISFASLSYTKVQKRVGSLFSFLSFFHLLSPSHVSHFSPLYHLLLISSSSLLLVHVEESFTALLSSLSSLSSFSHILSLHNFSSLPSHVEELFLHAKLLMRSAKSPLSLFHISLSIMPLLATSRYLILDLSFSSSILLKC